MYRTIIALRDSFVNTSQPGEMIKISPPISPIKGGRGKVEEDLWPSLN
jgi:hypothetical protein